MSDHCPRCGHEWAEHWPNASVCEVGMRPEPGGTCGCRLPDPGRLMPPFGSDEELIRLREYVKWTEEGDA